MTGQEVEGGAEIKDRKVSYNQNKFFPLKPQQHHSKTRNLLKERLPNQISRKTFESFYKRD